MGLGSPRGFDVDTDARRRDVEELDVVGARGEPMEG